ncbi:hypothetical protein [Finegoldia magna]|nr:hypothetical protein [Finegoldia magna]
MNRQKILLPINDSRDLNFDYMKKYMQIKEIKEQYKVYNTIIKYLDNYN